MVVGHVETREQHPDADKLSVCTVDVGGVELLQIVCGAPTVDAGQNVAVAQVGTRLPGDFKIKKAKIRGVESRGMICSVRELELGEDHDGIWVLPEGLTKGAGVAEAMDRVDWVLEIDNKSLTRRPDLWGHRGIAREIAALLGVEHDVQCRAVLYRTAGVQELGLAQDQAAGLLGGPAQLDQRCLAN